MLNLGMSIVAFGALYGQVDGPVVIRVQHADPYLLVALLRGQEVQHPEISTAAPWLGMPQGNQQGAQQNRGVGPEGTYIVNPSDNSIIFIPTRRQ